MNEKQTRVITGYVYLFFHPSIYMNARRVLCVIVIEVGLKFNDYCFIIYNHF